jgi:hypothetical protein
MGVEFKIKYTGAVPELLLSERRAQGRWNTIRREAWIVAGNYWHREFRPKHFTKAGAREYGYMPRAGESGNTRPKFAQSYTGRKLKKMGHTRPLVWSGTSETLSKIRVVRATATKTKSKAEVVLRTPGLNRQHKDSQIPMRDEMTAVSQAEARKLIEVFDNEVGRQLAAIHTQQTTQIR